MSEQIETLPLVLEAERDSMPGCRISELLTERWLHENANGPNGGPRLGELRRSLISDEDFKAWLDAQPEFAQFCERRAAEAVPPITATG